MNNLVLRAVTGTLFVVVLVGSMVFHPLSFTLLFALITGLTIWEFSTNVNRHAGAAVNRLINTTGGVYLFLAFFYFFSGFGKNYSDAAVFRERLPEQIFITLSDISEGMLRDARRAIGTEDSRFSYAAFDCQQIPEEFSGCFLILVMKRLKSPKRQIF